MVSGTSGFSIPGNKSAFDVVFLLDLPDGRQGALGIETKYHEYAEKPKEALKPEREERYREVTEGGRAHVAGAADQLIGSDLEQLWLDHLLALSTRDHEAGRWGWARFVLVYPGENASFSEAGTSYKELLLDRSTFGAMTLEHLLEGTRAIPPATVAALRDRYLG